MIKLRLVGAAQGFNWLPVFAAIDRGMFEDAEIALDLQKLGSVDKATKAVLDGDAELAITPPEGAVKNFINGGDLRIIASNSNRLPMSLVARPEILTIDQLHGKKIGTSSLTEGTAIYTQIMLAEAGLHYPGDYEFALSGIHTSRWDALLNGSIDAAPQPAPWNFLAEKQGFSLLGEVSDVIPEIVFAAVIGKSSWLDTQRDVVVRVLKVLAKAYDFANDPANEADCVKIFQRITTPQDEDLARRGFVYMRDLGMWPKNMAIPDRALDTTVDLMIKAGLLDDDRRTDARGAFDPSFIAELA